MGLLSKLLGATNKKVTPDHEVEVHFAYGSTNYQHLFALEDLIRTAIVDAAVGQYDGHIIAVDGSDAKYCMYGPDAEALFRVIQPLLEQSSFMRGAKVTLWYGPHRWRTAKRVIHLPS
ncbi:MAG TPA: hypothetical protein VNI36_00850 [Candidatus Dormibacteraeota bacterium]|nr:hypothetical protein [Candidatus Dormibacteraeota bacterium]